MPRFSAKHSANSRRIFFSGPKPCGWNITRTRPENWLTVRNVAAILSGLWPKSSITVTPFAVPTMSKRRAMPANSPSAAAACARVTPQVIAAAMAARALETLCLPGVARRT